MGNHTKKNTRVDQDSPSHAIAIPFSGEFRDIARQLRHDMDEMVANLWSLPRTWGLRPGGNWRLARVDLEDTGRSYVVKAELPGVPRDKVDVKATQDRLEISADAGTEHEERKKGYYYHEIGSQSFYRSLPLPSDADGDRVEAKMDNGVLEIRIPKKADGPKGRSVPIG